MLIQSDGSDLSWFEVPSSYLYFFAYSTPTHNLICSLSFFHSLPLAHIKPQHRIGKVHSPRLSLSVCSLKLCDRAVVTGISNTFQQLNWLCQPLSITNMHVESFIRRVNLLSFNVVWWGFWLCPCPTFFYFHLFLPQVLFTAVGL